jgi:hypothetical protein
MVKLIGGPAAPVGLRVQHARSDCQVDVVLNRRCTEQTMCSTYIQLITSKTGGDVALVLVQLDKQLPDNLAVGGYVCVSCWHQKKGSEPGA